MYVKEVHVPHNHDTSHRYQQKKEENQARNATAPHTLLLTDNFVLLLLFFSYFWFGRRWHRFWVLFFISLLLNFDIDGFNCNRFSSFRLFLFVDLL